MKVREADIERVGENVKVGVFENVRVVVNVMVTECDVRVDVIVRVTESERVRDVAERVAVNVRVLVCVIVRVLEIVRLADVRVAVRLNDRDGVRVVRVEDAECVCEKDRVRLEERVGVIVGGRVNVGGRVLVRVGVCERMALTGSFRKH